MRPAPFYCIRFYDAAPAQECTGVAIVQEYTVPNALLRLVMIGETPGGRFRAVEFEDWTPFPVDFQDKLLDEAEFHILDLMMRRRMHGFVCEPE